MATASATFVSVAVSKNCGNWVGSQWQASGCAVNTVGNAEANFTSSIPIGSRITGFSGSVSAHTSGVALTQPGYMSITAGGDFGSAGTLRALSAITDTSTSYFFSVPGLDIVVDANTFDGVFNVTFLNKENVYTSNHNLSIISNLTITYDPPSGNTLFFGSPF